MKTIRFILIILVSLFTSSLQGENFRTFKDTQGREMTARLTRVSGDDVYIERQDGLTTKVALSIFSAEDKKYIQEWATKNLLTSGIFEVRFTTENSSKRDSESGGIQRESYQSAYGIEVENTSYEPVKNIRIEYLLIKFEDALAAAKRSEGEIRRLKGEVKIDYIGDRSKATVKTKSVPMLETELAPGYVWSGGGKRTSKDVLKGIWIKMYVGDLLVHEYSKPENMMRTEAW